MVCLAVQEQHRRRGARERGRDIGVAPLEAADARLFDVRGRELGIGDAARISSGTARSADENGSKATTAAMRGSRPAANSPTDAPYETPSTPTRDTSQPRHPSTSRTADTSRASNTPNEMCFPVDAPWPRRSTTMQR